MTKIFTSALLISFSIFSSCNNADKSITTDQSQTKITQGDTAAYYLFRPKLEKEYGYSALAQICSEVK